MTPQRILIVEDETKLLQHLSQVVSAEGFSVFTCSSYAELENMIKLEVRRFDVVILDRLLHGKDSAALVGSIKNEMPDSRIMILSALNTAAEKANLLDMGADDYLAKPFDSNELVARIRVLMRRNRPEIRFGDIVMNSDDRSVRVRENVTPMTNKEFALLKTLMKAPGKVYSKSYLYEQVWEMNTEVESNVVEVTVNKIRRRLSDAGSAVSIKNTRNIGYWIEE